MLICKIYSEIAIYLQKIRLLFELDFALNSFQFERHLCGADAVQVAHLLHTSVHHVPHKCGVTVFLLWHLCLSLLISA